jgi:ubiquinone/menaquinone biosynthesis C-methylase UbiE
MNKDQNNLWDSFWQSKGSLYKEQLSQVDTQWELYEYVKFRHLDTIFPSKEGLISLECGCGTAGVSLHLSGKGYRVTMLDRADNALKLARDSFGSYSQKGLFVRGDVLTLPFPDNCFELVMSFGLLEHFADVKPLLREMVRVLKPGGILFADIVPRRFSVQTLGDLFFNIPLVGLYSIFTFKWKQGWEWIKERFSPPFFENRFSRREYHAFMRESGLGEIEIKGNNPLPRLILPRFLEQIFVGLMKKLIRLWQRFDRSDSWFSNELWCRGWWARGQKFPS